MSRTLEAEIQQQTRGSGARSLTCKMAVSCHTTWTTASGQEPPLFLLCPPSFPALWDTMRTACSTFGVWKVPESWICEFMACDNPGERSTSFHTLESWPVILEFMCLTKPFLPQTSSGGSADTFSLESSNHQYVGWSDKIISSSIQLDSQGSSWQENASRSKGHPSFL